MKSYDIFVQSGITIKLPNGVNPDTPNGYKILKDLVTKKFIENLKSEQVDFDWEEREEN